MSVSPEQASRRPATSSPVADIGDLSTSVSAVSPDVAADDVLRLARQIVAQVDAEAIPRVFPRATYRLQFNGSFTFRHAQQIVPYLARLGISHVYASPFLKAVSGSQHGYDIVDFGQLNPEVGTEAEFEQFVQSLQAHGLGLILDVVPNHMGIASHENPWWMDVLENGPSSIFASYFDIDWAPLKPDLTNKVLLPVLGDQFGKVLEDQQLQLMYEDGAFFVTYYERRFPIAPRASMSILTHRLEMLALQLDETSDPFLEFQSILTALQHLPERNETDLDKILERRREKEIIKRRLNDLCHSTPEILGFVLENVRLFNGERGQPHSFDLLEQLLENQAYRLAHWRVAADEINYRRFFDINDLAAIAMENAEVFTATHRLILRWIAEGKAVGLRIDHADGLYNPQEYFNRLQRTRYLQLCRAAARALPELAGKLADPVPEPADAAPFPAITRPVIHEQVSEMTAPSEEPPDALPTWSQVEVRLLDLFDELPRPAPAGSLARPLYVVVEKILGPNEPLPDTWPVYGTSGYEYLNAVNGLFVASGNARPLDNIYARFIRRQMNFRDLVYQCKKLILDASMSSELAVLGFQLDRISEKDRWSRDFTLNGETNAIREIIACFPVYRTYTDGYELLERDVRYTETAVARARAYNPAISASIFNFLRDILLLKSPDSFDDKARAAQRTFVGRFQQTTSPVMAKGLEDTSFYIYNRLVSLNDVGGSPERFGVHPAAFHADNLARQQQQPFTLLATSTHDTKRSEDVRARINVLSELPREWKAHVFRWTRWNQRRKTRLDGELAPSRNDEYLLYQTLIGTWPFEPMTPPQRADYVERIQQYAQKAVREAKVHTSWVNPNEAYEQALRQFIQGVLEDSPRNQFLRDFEGLAGRIAQFGMWNSLSQLVLKLTSPGVPDLFQGMETWNFSLVDPDNRRPVDFEALQAQLSGLVNDAAERDRSDELRALLATPADGRIKLYLTMRLLRWRREHPGLFREGSYLPLEVGGTHREHVVAFARSAPEHGVLLVVVPRLVALMREGEPALPVGGNVWRDTIVQLPAFPEPGTWHNVLTGQKVELRSDTRELAVARLLANCPMAVLSRTYS